MCHARHKVACQVRCLQSQKPGEKNFIWPLVFTNSIYVTRGQPNFRGILGRNNSAEKDWEEYHDEHVPGGPHPKDYLPPVTNIADQAAVHAGSCVARQDALQHMVVVMGTFTFTCTDYWENSENISYIAVYRQLGYEGIRICTKV